MTPRYDSLRKTERDAEVCAYADLHPDYSHQEIADHFTEVYGKRISRPTIWLILSRAKKNGS